MMDRRKAMWMMESGWAERKVNDGKGDARISIWKGGSIGRWVSSWMDDSPWIRR